MMCKVPLRLTPRQARILLEGWSELWLKELGNGYLWSEMEDLLHQLEIIAGMGEDSTRDWFMSKTLLRTQIVEARVG